MTIGIYRISNIKNNNSYIGQSKDIENRIKSHKEDLKDNKHHQLNLQKEYNNIKKDIKKHYKDNDLFNYLDYDKITIDKYYNIEILKQFDYYNMNELLEIEDQYILSYRNIQEGYKQKTNKEINQYSYINIIEEFKNKYPHYCNFMRNEFKKDYLKYKKLQDDYLNNKISLDDMQKEIIKITKLHYDEYIKLYNELKEE